MVTLDDDIVLLPTPAAADGQRGPDYARAGREESGGDDLLTALLKLQQEQSP
jgi:DNA (cytosine-5)-methyltransferase 1